MDRPQIAKIIDDLVWYWKTTVSKGPVAINNGWCGSFAQDLTEAIPGSTVQWNYRYPHAYVSYKGRHYDSETPYGVRRVTDLPCIQRLIREEKHG